jgi:hypothetical protein
MEFSSRERWGIQLLLEATLAQDYFLSRDFCVPASGAKEQFLIDKNIEKEWGREQGCLCPVMNLHLWNTANSRSVYPQSHGFVTSPQTGISRSCAHTYTHTCTRTHTTHLILPWTPALLSCRSRWSGAKLWMLSAFTLRPKTAFIPSQHTVELEAKKAVSYPIWEAGTPKICTELLRFVSIPNSPIFLHPFLSPNFLPKLIFI